MSNYLKPDERMTSQEKRQQSYRERYKEINPSWDDSIMLLARLFKEHVVPGAEVVDAGCGRGNYVLECNKAIVKKIIGVDASKEAVEGNEIADEIVLADLGTLPFADESFDAVTSLWVLEHVHEPEKVFGEVRRILKPGGKFFFVTPYAFSYVLLVKRAVGGHFTKLVLEKLYGRMEDDTFHTEYKVNTPESLRKQGSVAGMKEIVLIENEDPSYLAFNAVFFRLALLIQSVSRFFGWRIATLHLVGVFQKPPLKMREPS